ncbi:ATP-dependent RNA helicase HrpA [Anaerobiospirillum thomasii]|nr:ATP-dependent RNA helicase HrpA [Anaerobiospirillum thomasii]
MAGDISLKYSFFKQNLELVDDVEYLEDKIRRRDLLVDASVMQDFYDKKLPDDIVTQRHFEKWWSKKSKEDAHYLDFKLENIVKDSFDKVREDLYPESFAYESFNFKLSYVFDIKDKRDGVSVHIPVTVLNQLKADIFTWQIPGLRQDLVASLIRSLPKRLRRSLIPAPDYARAFLESVPAYDGNLYTLAAKEFTRICGERISADDFDFTAIDNHLLMTFVVEDLKGRELGSSKDLEALQHKMQGASQEALKQAVKSHKPMAPSDNWVYGSIERHKKTQHGSLSISLILP